MYLRLDDQVPNTGSVSHDNIILIYWIKIDHVLL